MCQCAADAAVASEPGANVPLALALLCCAAATAAVVVGCGELSCRVRLVLLSRWLRIRGHHASFIIAPPCILGAGVVVLLH